jgi:mRNA interferase RelE/StbE
VGRLPGMGVPAARRVRTAETKSAIARVEEVRVFYDVSGSTVEVLAIVAKSEADKWLAQFGSPK